MHKFLFRSSNIGEQGKDLPPTTDDAKENDDAFLTLNGTLMIFGGSTAYDSKRRQKVTRHEVNTAEPATPPFLRWSESAITFDRTDHLDIVPHPGRYPLVVDPIVARSGSPKYLWMEAAASTSCTPRCSTKWASIGHASAQPKHLSIASCPESRPCHLGRSICLLPSGISSIIGWKPSPSRWSGSPEPSTPSRDVHATRSSWLSPTIHTSS